MSAPLRWERLDPSGALAEAGEGARSRRGFLVGALGVGAGLGVAAEASGGSAGRGDVGILNYALSLEYLQAAFYSEAERLGALTGDRARIAQVVGAVERAHVAALRDALGGDAGERPQFDFQGTTEDDDAFLRTAVAFEDLGTAAYKDQLPLIAAPSYVAVAASLHSVEARHAAWIRYLAGVQPAQAALDAPSSRARTQKLVVATGFVARPPRTQASSVPLFTG